MTKIQVITGSTKPGRLNDQVAEWIYNIAKERHDLEVELVDIVDFNLPLFDEPMPPMMHQYQNEHTKKWAAKIEQADGYIFVTPEYNHSTSAALKNAIDYLNAEWNNKAVGFVSYGFSAAGNRAVEHLRQIVGEVQMADVRQNVAFSIPVHFENYTKLAAGESEVRDANTMLDQLTAWANALKTIRK